MNDANGKTITAGDVVKHTRHGQVYDVATPGTDGLLNFTTGLIVIPRDLPHRVSAWTLTPERAAKLVVMDKGVKHES